MASVMAATAFSGRTALMQRTSPLEFHMTPAMREDTASGRDADETKILRASACASTLALQVVRAAQVLVVRGELLGELCVVV